jgi:hypothetical protein
MLSKGATEEELALKLVEAFDIDEDRAQADARAFVDALAARGLLER